LKAVVDEGVPRELSRLLREAGCDAAAFPNEWKGTKNGKLLAVIEATGFTCLITCDKNFRYQQSLGQTGIALVVLPAQRLDELEHLVDEIAQVVRASEAGQTYVVQTHPAALAPLPTKS
jgi:hypothetical protein